MKGTAVMVMAKAPEPGLAKSRLAPALGAAGAARLARRFLAETVAQALAAKLGPVELCCAPDVRHPAFIEEALDERVTLAAQGDGDLGARMARAVARGLARAPRVLVVGTDAPALDARVLRAASEALAGHDAVFVPAFDGGYALVGLKGMGPGTTPWRPLFEHMPWSTDRVMALTRERLAGAGLGHAELPAIADVDTPDDLVHVPASWL
jgi:rSAM/selenodomain-associated transferase 1